MKQTQTKMFDFSDVGLDFCAGSKNLFPDRFKKMLAQGYNTQTVSSVVVTGNQVVLTYGVNHGYVADRVLELNAPNLTGEYVIDSVTSNTVTLTIDNPPTSILGGFNTFVAPLGWQLVYEQANIHIYKFKALDGSDLYLRLCFQNNENYRNRIAACVGKSFDSITGYITDDNSLPDTKSVLSPNIYAWEYSYGTGNSYDSYNYSQGYSSFGKAILIGSKYHLLTFTGDVNAYLMKINGCLPVAAIKSTTLSLPVLFSEKAGNPSSANGYPQNYVGKAVLGKYDCIFKLTVNNESVNNLDVYPQAITSFLPDSIDAFNTTTSELVPLYLENNGQFIGYLTGLFRLKYSSSNAPAINKDNLPLKTVDVDLNNPVYVHCVNSAGSQIGYATYFCTPIEEIKIGY